MVEKTKRVKDWYWSRTRKLKAQLDGNMVGQQNNLEYS